MATVRIKFSSINFEQTSQKYMTTRKKENARFLLARLIVILIDY
jgi:hypothetical protein